ncbi:MAG TPA: GlsB/YeaQ/YmgE family stress response membrane protein [Kofleriaceae bacterium]|nr:GlsB/YeaQ/YmgE family stress response membrane protein [Kofleriaceae bacterium]
MLASLVVGGGGYGVIGDLVIGVLGAYLGGYIFQRAGWHAPWAGLAGTVFVAFIGAAILLVVLHLIHGSFYGSPWRRRPPL